MQMVLSWVSRLVGLDIEFDRTGVFLCMIVIVLPIYAIVSFTKLARQQRRPVAWVATGPKSKGQDEETLLDLLDN